MVHTAAAKPPLCLHIDGAASPARDFTAIAGQNKLKMLKHLEGVSTLGDGH